MSRLARGRPRCRLRSAFTRVCIRSERRAARTRGARAWPGPGGANGATAADGVGRVGAAEAGGLAAGGASGRGVDERCFRPLDTYAIDLVLPGRGSSTNLGWASPRHRRQASVDLRANPSVDARSPIPKVSSAQNKAPSAKLARAPSRSRRARRRGSLRREAVFVRSQILPRRVRKIVSAKRRKPLSIRS